MNIESLFPKQWKRLKVSTKLKQAKEMLKDYNEKEFIQLNENYQAISYIAEYEKMQQNGFFLKVITINQKKKKQFKENIKKNKKRK